MKNDVHFCLGCGDAFCTHCADDAEGMHCDQCFYDLLVDEIEELSDEEDDDYAPDDFGD